jgi:hypothetical protein
VSGFNGHQMGTGVWLGSKAIPARMIVPVPVLSLEQATDAADAGPGQGAGQQRAYAKQQPVGVALPPRL